MALPEGTKLPDAQNNDRLEVRDGMVVHHFSRKKVYEGKSRAHIDEGLWDTFSNYRGSELQQREYFEILPTQILLCGSKREGEKPAEVKRLKPPLLLVDRAHSGGESWSLTTEATESAPASQRTFRIFGKEAVEVPAGRFEALKVDVTGRSGELEILQAFWFVEGVGFVKEEKVYYTDEEVVLRERAELRAFIPAESGIDPDEIQRDAVE